VFEGVHGLDRYDQEGILVMDPFDLEGILMVDCHLLQTHLVYYCFMGIINYINLSKSQKDLDPFGLVDIKVVPFKLEDIVRLIDLYYCD
jgi:hypothetical protein